MPFMDHMSGTDRRLSYSQHDKYMVCIMPFMDHMSGTDRRLSYSQHDKYMYVSCHSWITCQEPTEDCLIVNIISTCMDSWITCQEPTDDCLIINMISTGMYHAIHGSHVRNRQKIVL